jgi:hypothetical protein
MTTFLLSARVKPISVVTALRPLQLNPTIFKDLDGVEANRFYFLSYIFHLSKTYISCRLLVFDSGAAILLPAGEFFDALILHNLDPVSIGIYI